MRAEALPETTTTPRAADAEPPAAASTEAPYDCVGGFAHFGTLWPGAKKDWCCERIGRGCFLKVEMGTCADFGMHPILDTQVCEAASRDAGFENQIAQATDRFANRPEGCYELHVLTDGSRTLWLNLNKASQGQGAETSNEARGEFRQPLCAAKTAQHMLSPAAVGHASG